jgi:hypothetical protein
MSDTSESDPAQSLVIRGRDIRFDDNGLACLNDIWKAAGYSKHQTPAQWSRLPTTRRKIERVMELVMGKSHDYSEGTRRVFRTVRGRDAGSYADVRLALDYAEYLNPKLAIEVKEVFLRYKGGDATLADEVLQRASAEGNEWAAKRALGRNVRHTYTDQLQARGVKPGYEYGLCTNETYVGLFNRTASELRTDKALAKSASLRDAMPVNDLVKVAFSEVLSVERMEAEEAKGFTQCRLATRVAASSVRRALEANKQDSQPRLID